MDSRINIVNNCHTDATNALFLGNLLIENEEMSKNINRKIRYKNPTCGIEKEFFTIIGVQLTCESNLAYRVICENDNFGRVALPNEIEFIKYDFLNLNEVIIEEECLFNQDWGDYSILWIWNTQEKSLRFETINGYTKYRNTDFSNNIDKSKDIRKEAAEYYALNNKDYNYNKYIGNGQNTYVDCVVKLKRARKAPNKTELKVIKFYQGGWNGRFYTNDEVALVLADNSSNEIFYASINCIDEVIKGCYPYWYKEKI